MEAGRELDVLIAEKVMGLRQVEPPFCVLKNWPAGTAPWFAYDEVGHPALNYSTSIADAWAVVEKLRGPLGYKFYLYESELLVEGWDCELTYGAGNVVVKGIETAPHAICLAALKAVGVG